MYISQFSFTFLRERWFSKIILRIFCWFFFLSITYYMYKQFFREIPEMNWFAVIDFRDDKFSRYQHKCWYKNSWQGLARGEKYSLCRGYRELHYNFSHPSNSWFTNVQYASTFLNFCCNVVYADHECMVAYFCPPHNFWST